MSNIRKGVILAAGDGDRLGPLAQECPKVLLSAPDEGPLIGYPIRALAAAGIKDIAVVIGHLGYLVQEALCEGRRFGVRLEYVYNPDYLGGNAISVYRAREWTGGRPVVLCMGDHLIDRNMVGRLVNGCASHETLCVDYTPAERHDVGEATKVAVDDAGCIKAIGKDLIRWDALDTGVFLLTDSFFQALDELVRRRGTDVEMSDVIRFLIGRGHRFQTCDISGCSWIDVDTEEDLSGART